jgi:hypothetical protein
VQGEIKKREVFLCIEIKDDDTQPIYLLPFPRKLLRYFTRHLIVLPLSDISEEMSRENL